MDVRVVCETIDEILEILPFLQTTTSVTGLSATDTEQLKKFLNEIQLTFLHKENHNHNPDLLRLLKNAVNDLTDLVEELTTINASPYYERKFPFLRSNPIKQRLKLTNFKTKKLVQELQHIANNLPPATSSSSSSTKQLLDPAAIEKSLELVGREKEKNEIIDQLIILRYKTSAQRDVDDVVRIPVVTIVGFDGIGKTELSNLICSDHRIKAHFGVQIHLTETFDVESIQKRVNDSPISNGKGYLVVLNNLRSEIHEKNLFKLQQILTETGVSSGGASAILITTSSKLVANNITATIRGNLDLHNSPITAVKPHVLQGLNENDSWSLYLKIRERSSVEVNDDMVKQIVKDCGGVPLWIIITATFVNNRGGGVEKGGGEEEVEVMKEEFLQEMKIRFYDELPRVQKLCFAFCSLFPRDHLMDVERIIRLLIAEGGLFLDQNPKSAEEEEQILRGYFNDFVGRPVFKDMEEDERGVVRKCRMQPIMHDLARFVSDKKENITVDPEGDRVHKGVLRASFDFTLDVSRGIPDTLYEKAKKLRAILLWKTHTLVPKEMKTSTSTCDNIFKTFKTTLRLLDLHDSGIKVLPTSIGELINLRYLDLSLNKIVKLPSSITKLSNLQTLKLSNCYLLKELPKNIEDLVSLRHLELEGCLSLTQMPLKIHELNLLQTLSIFVVSKDIHHSGGLTNLASINNLRGHLEILHLERSTSSLAQKDMYLKRKSNLQRLTLRWGDEDEDVRKGERDKKTLDCLEPSFQLRVLFIVGYKGGSTLSSWISSIKFLVKLYLYDCSTCKFLPPLGQLPNLRFLELLRLDNLLYVEDNDDKVIDSKQGVYFPSLEELTISDCPKLKSWWKTVKKAKDDNMPYYYFPCISKLRVCYCPNLMSMPLYPSLDEELVLVDSSIKPLVRTILNGKKLCNQFSKLKSLKIASSENNRSPEEQWLRCFSSLEKLEIREWKHLVSLPEGFGHLTSLQSLTIENCQELNLDLSESEWEGLKNLRSLVLRENPKLKSLPIGADKVTSLQVLELHNCPEITSLPKSIRNLKSLGRLVISKCHKLARLPEGLKELKSLNTLIILDCALLLPRCQRDTGDDWPYISHVTNIQLMTTLQDI